MVSQLSHPLGPEGFLVYLHLSLQPKVPLASSHRILELQVADLEFVMNFLYKPKL